MNWHRIVSIIFAVFVMLLGLVGMACYRPELWEMVLMRIEAVRFFFYVSGAVVWVLAIAYVLTPRRRKKNTRYLTFDNEGGTVSISTDAIADYVSKLMSEFPSIVEMTPMVKPARNHMDILLKLKVKAGSQVSDICQMLQQRVRESISSGLGIEEVGKVEVSVEGIISEHVKG